MLLMMVNTLWLLHIFVVLATANNPMENDNLFEGDINIPELIQASNEEKDVYSNVLGARRSNQWPDAVMPYKISITNSKAVDVIHAAMDEWEEKTCTMFVERSDETNYVEFITGRGGCWSNGIGQNGNGRQLINLDSGCWYKGTVIHEIGHALGFWHEQSRPDRDDYIKIIWNNIRNGLERQFKKYSRDEIDSLNVPYDYASIMHYPRRAFSKNNQDTIVPKKSGVTIGQRSGLSKLDARQANLLYKCLQVTKAPPTSTVPVFQENLPGYILHLQSKNCLYPLNGKVSGEGHPIVASSECGVAQSLFQLSSKGVIKHVISGMCLHPTGDCINPDDNTELVVTKNCESPEIVMKININGKFQHVASETCVRPVQGWEKVPTGTRFVIHSKCDVDKYAFAFAVSRPNSTNLALNKKAYQSSTGYGGLASNAIDGRRSGDYFDYTCTHTLPSKSPWWLVDLGKERTVGSVYISNRADCCWERISNFQIAVGNIYSGSGKGNAKCGGKHSLKRGETRRYSCEPALKGRYVTIFKNTNNYVPLTLCEVEVYAEPMKAKTTTPTSTDLRVVLQHKTSKLCVVPRSNDIVNNTAVVLAPKCSEAIAKFRKYSDGSLLHVASNMCLSPKTTCDHVDEDTEIVLADTCGSEDTMFYLQDDGTLIHEHSEMCARPSTSNVSNKQTTLIVLSSECDAGKVGFEIITNPIIPTKTNEVTCGRVLIKSTLVVGGVDAKPGTWPWQVALLKRGRFVCGGSLIKKDWVITAAHCISNSDNPKDITVVLGEYNRNKDDGHEVNIEVERFIKHSDYYKPSPINNDVALLQLKQTVHLNHYINTVCLPEQNYKISPGTKCYITGWGKIRHPGSSHPVLQQAEMRTVSNTDCSQRLKKKPSMSSLKITPQMLCAGNEKVITSGCHGDSGGPFVCKDDHDRWYLQGAVSWGDSTCSSSKFYTVFARLAQFRSWIDTKINNIKT